MRLTTFLSAFLLLLTSWAQDLPDYFLENIVVSEADGRITANYDLSTDVSGPNVGVSLYLSDDQQLSTGDVLLTTWPSIAVGSNSNSVSVSSRVETGTWFVILVVNRDLIVRESNYSNNVATANETIEVLEGVRGDFYSSDWTLDASDYQVDDFITSNLNVTRDGNIPGSAFTITYLLSEDSVYDTDDYVLEFSQNNFANSDPGTTITRQFQIPPATNTGTWRVLAQIDSEGFYFESDETNNLVVHDIFVNPATPTNYIINSTNLGGQTEFERGERITFEFVVGETENDLNYPTPTALYLSRDSTFSSDDRQVRTEANSPIEFTDQMVFNVPLDIDTGFYQLLVVADYLLGTKETDETDNVGVHRIKVIPSPKPDLEFEEILFQSALSAGQSYTNQNYSYQNLTGISSNRFEISFFISEDSTLDNSDVLLYNNPSESTPSNTNVQTRAASFTLPTNIDSGEYLLLSYLDFIDEVDEDDELNNDTIISITILNPDLTIGVLTSTETVSGAGLNIPVNVRVDNISETSGYAASSTLRFYLSEDELPDNDDIPLRQINVSPLQAGFNSTEFQSSVTFPNTIDAGDYFVLALADADSLLSENLEDNNWSTIPITIELPDLEVKSPIINPSTITAGKSVTMEFRVDNNASITSPPSQVKLYLSEDEELNFDEDYFLRTINIESIEGGGSSTDKEVTNVRIPEIEEGDYKILFAVDADSLISESDETNNIKTGDITLTNPDILPLNLELSRELVGSGENTMLEFVVTNQGAGDIDNTDYTLWLSGTQLAQDLYLGDGFTEALEASATSQLKEENLFIPAYIQRGEYYVKVIVDSFNSELESDEINNADSILLEVTNPDLTLDNIIASPNVISVGFPTTIELDVENLGKVNAPPTSLSYVLSADNVIDNNDFFYNTRSVPAIDSLKDVTISSQLTIPSAIDPGDYFIILDVDPQGLIPELDENNNRISVEITINVPDLAILNEGLDKEVVGTSEVLEMETRVTNLSSSAKAPNSFLYFYLSEDETVDGDDRLADIVSVESLELGATSTNKVVNYTIPADVEAGNYFILFSADAPQQVNESDETNNVAAVSIEIVNPDLNPTNLVLSKSSLELSEAFNVTVQIDNIGDSKSASGNVKYYLSTEEMNLNDSSIYLGQNFHGEIAIAESATLENYQVSIPSFIDPADYNLLVFVDPDSLIAEMDENNNIVSSPINLLFADLLTINQEIDKETVSVGDTLTVSYNLKNDGSVASNSSITSFYLAGNDTILLGSFNEFEASLEANGTASSKDIELIIPISVEPGDYQLAIQVDLFNNTVESDEDNNVSTLDVTITPIDLVAVSGITLPSVIEPDSTNFNDQSYQEVRFSIDATATINPSLIQTEVFNALQIANLYISEDEIIDDSDTMLFVIDRRVIYTGADDDLTYTITGTGLFPFDIPKGDYFAIFEIDGDSLITESDETNNAVTTPITYGNAIKPDIVALEQQTIPSKLTIDKDVIFMHHYINDGATRTTRHDNSVYLSNDELLDGGDLLLGTESLSSSNQGLTKTVRYEFELTDLLPDGTSYLIGTNDELDLIKEQSETNNDTLSEITFYQPLPIDFAPTCSNQLPMIVRAGDRFEFAYEVENLGTGIPENLGVSVGDNFLTIEMYLSDDEALSSDDQFLRADYGKAVSPHEIVGYRRTLPTPADLTPGTYYVIVQVDSEEEYDESDESNNTLALAITIEDPIIPDLRIEFDYIETSIEANNNFETGIRVFNQGGSFVENVEVAFYISEINSFSEDLRELEVENNEISVGAYESGTNRYFYPLIPFDITPGRYIIFARIDDGGNVAESNEDNNLASAAIEVQNPIVTDFFVSPITSAVTAYQGEIADNTYQVSYFLTNDGTKPDAADVGIYFSLDNIWDEQDILLDETNDIFLNAFGNSRSLTSFVELPDLFAGDYFIFIVADPEEELLELNRENNILSLNLTVLPPSKPDVTPESRLSVSNSTVGLNEVIQITQTIGNIDRAPVDSVLVSFYISTDPTISSNDLFLTELYSGPISGFGSTVVAVNEIIPTSLSIGDYFLISVLDDDDRLDESNEANNEESLAITITDEVAPDFIPSINSLSSSAVSANTLFSINYSVTNNGAGSALGLDVSFYLSKDDVVDGTDIFLQTDAVGFIGSGSTRFANSSILIPEDADPGDYNLIMVADPDDMVDEEDETNNEDLMVFEVLEPELPDLSGFITSIPGVVNARQVLDISQRVQNNGLGVAPESTAAIYLSDDDVFDSGDTQLGSAAIVSLPSGSFIIEQIEVTIPDVEAGNYFVFGVVDANEEVEETDETNNTYTVAVEVGAPVFPDLTISSITLDETSVNAGNEVEVSALISNIGDNQSEETTIEFFLSTDEVVDSGDQSLGVEAVDRIKVFNSQFVNATYVIPPSTSIGDYFILGQVNPNQTLEESDYDNNTGSTSIEILERLLPDLEVTFASVQPEEIPAGQDGNLSISIFNTGGGSAGSFSVEVYLSTDQTIGSGDELLSTVNVDGLAFGGSTIAGSSFTIDETTAIGSYFLLIDVDTDNTVEENDESNNEFNLGVEILESLKADLIARQLALDASSINAGGTIGVSFEVFNQGDITSSADAVGVYFSEDNTLDTSDELISTLALDPINVNSGDTFSASVPVPLDESPGDYFIIVNVDDNDSEEESDESNNTAVVGVEVTEPLPGNLTITDISLDETSVNAGTAIEINVTISNNTTNAVLPYSAAVYISDNQTIGAEDVMLAEQSFDILEGQGTQAATFNATLPSTLDPGDYFIIARVDSNQEVSETDEDDNDSDIAVTILEALSVADENEALILFPNPVQDVLNIRMAENKKGRVSIYDIDGRLIYREHINAETHQLNVSDIDPGEYFLIIDRTGGDELRERFIKE